MKFIWLIQLIFYSICGFAQTKNCKPDSFKNLRVKGDSVSTFNNRLVKNKVLTNIRNSRYELEFRAYITGTYNTEVDVIVFQKDDREGLRLSTKKVFITNYSMPRTKDFVIVSNAGKSYYNVNTQVKAIPDSICKLLQRLKTNHFFSISGKGLLPDQKKKKSTILDAGASFYFEIKFKNRFRNFELIIDDNYDAPDYVTNIVKVFQQLQAMERCEIN